MRPPHGLPHEQESEESIARYIELFYYRRRLHSALGYRTPHEGPHRIREFTARGIIPRNPQSKKHGAGQVVVGSWLSPAITFRRGAQAPEFSLQSIRGLSANSCGHASGGRHD